MTNQMLRLYAILADAIVPEPQATAATTAAAAAAVAPESKESKESKGEENTTTATTTTATATVNVGGERTDAQYWLSTFDFDTCIIPFLLSVPVSIMAVYSFCGTDCVRIGKTENAEIDISGLDGYWQLPRLD